jgi:hypothetical protein
MLSTVATSGQPTARSPVSLPVKPADAAGQGCAEIPGEISGAERRTLVAGLPHFDLLLHEVQSFLGKL